MEFRDWFVAALENHDLPALLDWRQRAPHAARAHPSPEHLLPLFVALGAAGENAAVEIEHRDFQLAALALDAFAFTPVAT
jgi:4,5-DOPA dioxygenase extradiol